jgi:hypothetical protein
MDMPVVFKYPYPRYVAIKTGDIQTSCTFRLRFRLEPKGELILGDCENIHN